MKTVAKTNCANIIPKAKDVSRIQHYRNVRALKILRELGLAPTTSNQIIYE